MRILLTNDDGIYAPGLRALLSELRQLGEVVVVAPATEQSAVGHSVTILTPLLAQEVFDENGQLLGWAVERVRIPGVLFGAAAGSGLKAMIVSGAIPFSTHRSIARFTS